MEGILGWGVNKKASVCDPYAYPSPGDFLYVSDLLSVAAPPLEATELSPGQQRSEQTDPGQ